MPEDYLPGISILESPSREQPVQAVDTSVTAFVGRTSRGPVGEPVSVSGFAEFQQVFGGLWEASTLSYSVSQFFANGGRHAIVVRVVNGARVATLDITAGHSVLELAACNPGAREPLRVSIDYDNLPETATDRFNLVVQRVRETGSSIVEDQEIFGRVSVLPGADRYLGDVLVQSRLIRIAGDVPLARPAATVASSPGHPVTYIDVRADGDDGQPLTDYDIIGSVSDGTGLFALNESTDFSMLCIPPLYQDGDVGVVTLLAAARFCRQRRALLIADAPADWRSAAEASLGVRRLNFSSDNVAMYFPRLWLHDPLLDREAEFAPSGAVAGVLGALQGKLGVWQKPGPVQAALASGTRLTCTVSETESADLERVGLNCLRKFPGGIRAVDGFHTMAGVESSKSHWKYLPVRRLTLMILRSLEQGTRWVVFEQNEELLWVRLTAQVETFLDSLFQAGAFAGSTAETAYFVKCDIETTRPEDVRKGRVNVVVGFAPTEPGDFLAFTVSQRVNETVIRPCDYNPFAIYLT